MELAPHEDQSALWAYAAGERDLDGAFSSLGALDGLAVACASFSPDLQRLGIHGSTRVDPAHLDVIRTRYPTPESNIAFRHGLSAPEGRFIHRDRSVSWDAIRAMPFYEDFWRPTGVGPDGGSIRLPIAGLGDMLVFLGWPEGRPSPDDARRAAIDRTMALLRRAVEMRLRLDGRTALAGERTRAGVAAIVVDEARTALTVPEDAAGAFARGAPVALIGGTLNWHGAAEEGRLDAAFASALAGREARVTLAPRPGEGPLTAAMVPGPVQLDRPTVIVAILRPRPAEWSHAALAAAYGLTPREGDIALGLLAGRRPAEIAETLRIQPASVRLYLKRVYAKTGTDGQVPLVALLAGALHR